MLPSSEDGGDGSCAAIIPERACDLATAERNESELVSFGNEKKKELIYFSKT